MAGGWHPATWRSAPAAQQPVYADPAHLAAVEARLARSAPLAAIAKIDALRGQLAQAAAGRALLLQGGDCAEIFAVPDVAGLAALFERLAALLDLPVVPVARIAGQYAKPRTVEGKVWRGEIVNGRDALEPDPERMLRAHAHAADTVERLPGWLHTSHEALLLPFEQALVRRADDGRWFSGSGHMLWLGERTRDVGGAHVVFLGGIANPIGVKLGKVGADELRRLADALDPLREPGRLTLIVRMGDKVGQMLPPLVRAMRQDGRHPLWVSDPLHGNTERGGSQKVRRLSAITQEVEAFVGIMRAEGVPAGGLHLEMTAENVAEVSGGHEGEGWTSACDPRLNPRQTEVVVGAFAAAAAQRHAA